MQIDKNRSLNYLILLLEMDSFRVILKFFLIILCFTTITAIVKSLDVTIRVRF